MSKSKKHKKIEVVGTEAAQPLVPDLTPPRSQVTGDVQVGGIAGEAVREATVQPGLRHAHDREQQTEQTMSWFKKLMTDPKNVPPMIIGSDLDGNIRMHAMKKQANGAWVLPKLKLWSPPTLADKIRRRMKIRRIMKHLDPILKRDIGDVASLALERKTDEQLDSLHERLKRKNERKQIHLTTRVGCVFIETADESIQL